ncbi:glutathione S-transferase family protein [Blastochloris sulfoviridis]|uniref:Glutathione S-transferase family protein n=1 Tax=Blastochloris sulfoviridis TaxID=50712 RepID=A0A5M6HXS9_9HYPH|nr:glutathione S-transferase family protein [Blastochloris sulfoviridis]KAA5600428.1 glutathione S-transferase family protein [Blastochloris sulfoviridis]
MPELFHLPFCPLSRFVRLALGEYGVDARLIEERPWDRREAFLILNPAGTLPVLRDDDGRAVPGVALVAEYLDEAIGETLGDRRLLPVEIDERIEVRRLMAWFFDKFYHEVAGPLVGERIDKRMMTLAQGGGPPDMTAIRAAKANIKYHLQYIGWLLRGRNWLAGERLTYADIAAAAQLSSVDYLGDVPWHEDEAAKQWYAKMKSRPSFRPILADAMAGMPASPSYADLDF